MPPHPSFSHFPGQQAQSRTVWGHRAMFSEPDMCWRYWGKWRYIAEPVVANCAPTFPTVYHRMYSKSDWHFEYKIQKRKCPIFSPQRSVSSYCRMCCMSVMYSQLRRLNLTSIIRAAAVRYSCDKTIQCCLGRAAIQIQPDTSDKTNRPQLMLTEHPGRKT